MARVNENFLNLENNHLFSTILEKKNNYLKNNPDKKIINMGIGDVTLPIAKSVVSAMHKAVDEMGNKDTFKGYGLVEGYDFLREKISKCEYLDRELNISKEEVFVADGTKNDLGNIIELFSNDNIISITDPVYPAYRDANFMAGRNKILYINCIEENNFLPQIPNERVDIIYLCCPNNPTGTVLNKKQLKEWVDYAKKNNSIILYDSVYECFITEENIPHSIYEIEGAKEVAVEFRSFSKLAGFTGLRCSFVVIPEEVKLYGKNGDAVKLQDLWKRRQNSKFGGVSYITQRGAEAIYTEQGQKEIRENIKYYLENAKYIKSELEKLGLTTFGGDNSPYIWFKVPNGESSWSFFDFLLNEASVIGTPGEGFGKCGEGFFRITSFGNKEDCIEAVERMKKIL